MENYISETYHQKSLNFLFPLLGFSKWDKFKPKNTFLYWDEEDYSIDDYNLLVFYETVLDKEFKDFEEKNIISKENLIACFIVEGGMLYVFDLVEYAGTVAEFLEGSYSKFGFNIKNKILTFRGEEKDKTVKPGRFVHMSLFPDLYKKVVADELGQDEEDLVELGNKFNFEKEVCNIPIINNVKCCEEKKTFYLDNGD